MASLKKLVAIWIAMAPTKVRAANHGSNEPVSFHASTPPTHTGTTAAGKVFGREASRQDLKMDGLTREVETIVLRDATPYLHPNL
jgi:hypothetical protein